MKYYFNTRFLLTFLPVLMLSLGLSLSVGAQQRTSKPLDGIIVKVDNQIVLRSELETSLAQIAGEGQQVTSEVRCNVLRSLLLNDLMLAGA